jgi:hypothetical protein
MGVWLYPVSRSNGYGFIDARGKRRESGYESVRHAIEEGVFPKRAEWPCVQNGRNVAAGDDLFLYSGDVGIFAAGRVLGAEPAESGGRWVIAWRLDLRRTKRLLRDPVPADRVRKHVHPRVTVRDFTKGAKASGKQLI